MGVQFWFYVYITHKITENHLTLPHDGLLTFSSNMAVTFFELYYCAFSIQKWEIIKQKQEIAHYAKYVRIWSYSGLHFPAFALNTKRYDLSLRIQSECGKMRTRKTQNTVDISLAVAASHHPWKSIFKLFLKLSWLEKSFMCIEWHVYSVWRYPRKKAKQNIINIEGNVLFLDHSRSLLFTGDKQ